MAIEPKLHAVAELAFQVARTGIESTPSVAAPAPMRSFLYVANLPSRALSVAVQTLDTDDVFRQRVAAVAEPTAVGTAGWLYVARPDGWEADYDAALTADAKAAIPTAPRTSAAPPIPPTAPPPPPGGSSAAIESELSELKDLVERLTVEREQVSASVAGMEADYEARAERGDQVSDRLAGLEAQLAEARAERDQAVSRLLRAETEAVTLRAQDSPAMNERDAAREALDVANLRLSEVSGERDALREELDVLRAEQERLTGHLEAARDERDEARAQLAEARAARDDALVRLSDAEQARDDARAEALRLGTEWEGIQSQVAELREERQVFAAELDRVAQVEAEQRTLVSGLSRRLDDVETERDRLIQKLRVAEARLGGTREAFADATARLQGDLDAAEQAVTESTSEADALSDAIDRTTRYADQLVEGFQPGDDAEPAGQAAAPAASTATFVATEPVAPEPMVPDTPGTAVVDVAPTAYLADDTIIDDSVTDETAVAEAVVDEVSVDEVADIAPVVEDTIAVEVPAEVTADDIVEVDEVVETPEAVETDDDWAAADTSTDTDVETAVDGEADLAAFLEDDDVDLEASLASVGEPAAAVVSDEAWSSPVVDDEPVDLGAALAGVDEPTTAPDFGQGDDSVDLGQALATVGDDTVAINDNVDVAGAIEPPPFGGFSPDGTSLGFEAGDPELDAALAGDDVNVADTLGSALPAGFGVDTPDVDPISAIAGSGAGIAAGTGAAVGAVAGAGALAQADTLEAAPTLETGGVRHQVPMPDDIAGDPFRRTKMLIAAENAILLVDGDAVASLGWPSLGVAERRDALVDYLGDLVDDHATAVDVVFDGGVGDESNLPVRPTVRIRLTKTDTRPAVALSELVDAYPTQWPVTVATDNANLELVAREKGAAVVTNGDLLDLFLA